MIARFVAAGLVLASYLGPPGLAAAERSAVPTILQAYIHDGTFDPGDFQWMAGRWSEAPPADRRQWETVRAYINQCSETATLAMRQQLAALGIEAVALPSASYGDALCGQIKAAVSLRPASPADFAQWPHHFARAKLLWEFALAGAGLNQAIVRPYMEEGPDALIRATIGEQYARRAMSWDRVENAPPLPEELQPFFQYLAELMVDREDRKNTEFLRGYIEEKGWPKISEAGNHASRAAWLLAQHADQDPALQLRALRLMEPLAKEGEVDKSNYAYLYDRVMLKISGFQRYATQFSGCEHGHRERPLRPLENNDPQQLDQLRAAMGLEPLAHYRAFMDRSFGPCPG
ncbi:DUF6624 domain-containing protein [Sphingopyxis sp. MWB1]|uniref:DUF6624 domain-containing protein n=1 Tax=Sphingopyxis sp. MWB1 TaxID=1537715 RepID=UPI00118594EC|nr:DUF6624 domain-containing protein [Sphingopyxis sp. MWB1]